MHIVLISTAEKKAAKQTSVILDRYAMRTSEQTWETQIDEECVHLIREQLRQSAIQQIAVACYQINNNQRSLLWVVGSHNGFNHNGVATGTQKKDRHIPEWIKAVSLLTQAAIYGHALAAMGKQHFKHISQEWASMKIMHGLRANKSWDTICGDLQKERLYQELGDLKQGICSADTALDYVVATHATLFGPGKGIAIPNCKQHCIPSATTQAEDLPLTVLEQYQSCVNRLKQATDALPADAWRGLAMLAKVVLRLTKQGQTTSPNGELEKLSEEATKFIYQLDSQQLPGLSQVTVDYLLEPAIQAQFHWQNTAVDVLKKHQTTMDTPALVFNIAAPGTGKTQMNIKAACALRPQRPRFIIAQHTQDLSLNTHHYSHMMKIGTDELATVTVQAGPEYNKTADNITVVGSPIELPNYLLAITEKQPKWRTLFSVPTLLSSIEFLSYAGDPGSQDNHVAAVVRLMNNDLILDDIDSYTPSALVATLRTIQMAALLGRHVICSGATLSTVTAKAIYEAFASGIKMLGAMEPTALQAVTIILEDRGTPSTSPLFNSPDEFVAQYQQHITQMLTKPVTVYRKPYLQTVADKTVKQWNTAVLSAVNTLHQAHAWSFDDTDKSLSVGLVKVTDADTAIQMARYLAEQLPHARVASYHAQTVLIHRIKQSQRLNELLNCHQAIEQDADIQQLVMQSSAASVPLIVVTDAAIETGDFDFDWAVVEPSSIYSLVKTAGQVNRHRLDTPDKPNIAILQYNWRYIISKTGEPVFCNPGLETGKAYRYSSHDMSMLLDWKNLDTIDAQLPFGNHQLAQEEKKITNEILQEPLKIICAASAYASVWMTTGFYHQYSVDDKNHPQKSAWLYSVDDYGDDEFKRLEKTNYQLQWIKKSFKEIERIENDWLVWPTDELKMACEQANLSLEQGFNVSLNAGGKPHYDRSFGFTMVES